MAQINPLPQASWFEIDEDVYLMYLLKGYEIEYDNDWDCVYISLDGQWHREDGPAIIHKDNSEWYYLNDNYYTKEQYYEKLAEHN